MIRAPLSPSGVRVQAIPRDVQVYETADGSCPYETWVDKLSDKRTRARIRVRIDRLEDGNLGDCKPVGDGVNELRIDFGPGYRVYFAEDGPTVILLLCGGDKGTQTRDIKIAKEYWKDYKRS